MVKHWPTFWQYMFFFACNTAFHHASRHKTTWTGWLKDQNAPSCSSKTVAIYIQIDFVLCKQNAKLMLQDARSYGGATISSDHKPVVARLRFDRRCLMYKQPKKRYPKLDLTLLDFCLMRTHALHICYLSVSGSTVCPFHLTRMPDWRGC